MRDPRERRGEEIERGRQRGRESQGECGGLGFRVQDLGGEREREKDDLHGNVHVYT